MLYIWILLNVYKRTTNKTHKTDFQIKGRGGIHTHRYTSETHLTQQPEEHIRGERSLVRLVHYNGRITVQIGIAQTLAQQNTIGHVLDNGAL